MKITFVFSMTQVHSKKIYKYFTNNVQNVMFFNIIAHFIITSVCVFVCEYSYT